MLNRDVLNLQCFQPVFNLSTMYGYHWISIDPQDGTVASCPAAVSATVSPELLLMWLVSKMACTFYVKHKLWERCFRKLRPAETPTLPNVPFVLREKGGLPLFRMAKSWSNMPTAVTDVTAILWDAMDLRPALLKGVPVGGEVDLVCWGTLDDFGWQLPLTAPCKTK